MARLQGLGQHLVGDHAGRQGRLGRPRGREAPRRLLLPPAAGRVGDRLERLVGNRAPLRVLG